jgi:hypothetical protein
MSVTANKTAWCHNPKYGDQKYSIELRSGYPLVAVGEHHSAELEIISDKTVFNYT